MSKKDVIEYYDDPAQDYYNETWGGTTLAIHLGYWTAGTKSHEESLLNMNRLLARRAGIRKRDLVLDAGCGIGGSSIWLANNIGSRVIGITLMKRHVSLASRLAKERGAAGLVRFHAMDFTKTRFKKDSFEVVWALESVCHAENKSAFVKEAYRLLKRGGRLVVADGFVRGEGSTSGDRQRYRTFLRGWAVPNLSTPGEFRSYLTAAGFRRIRFRDSTKNVLPSSARFRRMVARSVGSLSLPSPSALPRNLDHVQASVDQHRLLKSGFGLYGIFCAEK